LDQVAVYRYQLKGSTGAHHIDPGCICNALKAHHMTFLPRSLDLAARQGPDPGVLAPKLLNLGQRNYKTIKRCGESLAAPFAQNINAIGLSQVTWSITGIESPGLHTAAAVAAGSLTILKGTHVVVVCPRGCAVQD
jgi:hypothetical protein